MNPYIKDLNRIEFMMTLACTGKCKHCSEGTHDSKGAFLQSDAAVDLVRKVAGKYQIASLMVFGGEPLLRWESVCAIFAAAQQVGIPQRQLITNGYFTKDPSQRSLAARKIVQSGVNAILLSVDAFHQETIPLEAVQSFAREMLAEGIWLRTHPAWLVSSTADNPYNHQTREILKQFEEMGIAASEGNTIFPEGNALIYLKEYFDQNPVVRNPYQEDPREIRSICVDPEGNVLGENIYRKDILDILSEYSPEEG